MSWWRAHVAQDGRAVAGAVGPESLLENALILPVGVGCLLHLVLGRLRVDDAVLTNNLLAVARLVLRLLLQELLDRLLEVIVEDLPLLLLEVEAVVRCALRVGLELLHLPTDLGVRQLRLRDQVAQRLPRSVVAAGKGLLMQGRDVLDAGRQALDLLANS